MIHFEIIKSPDLNVQTNFKFFKNEVYLGRNSGDLAINDPELLEKHLLLEVPEKELLIHPQREVSHFLINGKRATSIRTIKTGDIVTIGKSAIKILAFERTEYPSKKTILNEKLNKLIESESLRLPIIEQLTKLMK